MGTKGWIIFVSAAVLVLGGLVYFSQQGKVNVDDYDTAGVIAGDDTNGGIGDRVYGDPASKVVLVEYGDYQCPGCKTAYPIVKTVTEKYKGQIAFVFRNFPLTSAHPNARAAAATVEAAGQQGKFWEMHDKIYEQQDDWKNASTNDRSGVFRSLAEDIGLDVSKYDTDVASSEIAKKINFDLALGRKDKISGTPSFFLNGKALESNAWGTTDALEAAIVEQLKAHGIALPEAAAATPAE